MKSLLLAAEVLLASTALAQLEIGIEKKDKHSKGQSKDVAGGFVKNAELASRQGTLETTAFPIFVYSSGGAYFANSKLTTLQSYISDDTS